jgi:broad specificity phosphatase PhoE
MSSSGSLSAGNHTLYFVRHGETDWNAQNRLLGHTDVVLNDVGRRQAADAGVCLGWLNAKFASLDFIAGPLTRTRETIEILRNALGLDPVSYRQDERLTEIDFGRWEGLTWDEIRATDPSRFQLREIDPMSFVMPDGESYAMLFERVDSLLETICRDSVIVSHGGVCRALLALLAGVAPAVAPKLDIPQDQILMLRGGCFAWLQATTDLKLR